MPRIPMVTRRIKTTNIVALCMDTERCEPMSRVYQFAGHIKNEDKLIKKMREEVDTDTFKFVELSEVTFCDKLYGMTELDFLSEAQELDENRKPVEDSETE